MLRLEGLNSTSSIQNKSKTVFFIHESIKVAQTPLQETQPYCASFKSTASCVSQRKSVSIECSSTLEYLYRKLIIKISKQTAVFAGLHNQMIGLRHRGIDFVRILQSLFKEFLCYSPIQQDQ